ncbi:hypothetical protein, partial [Ancylobacter vacuolatus]|uniref:hypothetical protein n=1 Tax=Ancylobacter vacuolatus TaxID=223389 RepID=UPI00363ECAE3
TDAFAAKVARLSRSARTWGRRGRFAPVRANAKVGRFGRIGRIVHLTALTGQPENTGKARPKAGLFRLCGRGRVGPMLRCRNGFH